jgi:excisionase family DNA binding protein
MEPYVPANEVAKFLNLSPRTVAKMAREGRLPAHRISGSERKTWRFPISEVAAFVGSGASEMTGLGQKSHAILQFDARPGCSAERE